MSSPAKKELPKTAIRLVTAGAGALIAGPLGAAIGGTVGGVFGDLVGRVVSEHAARLIEKGAERGGDTLSEFFVHYCYEKFQERDEHSLDEAVRQSLGYGLAQVRVSLESNLQKKYSGWFENWDLWLSGADLRQIESLMDGAPQANSLETDGSLFRSTLERLNGEQAIKAAKSISVVGARHFQEMPEELFRLISERLPGPFDKRFRDLLTEPQYAKAWKQVGERFQDDVRSSLSGLHVKMDRVIEILEGQDGHEKPPLTSISIAKLPTVNEILIGRDAELKQLDAAWDNPKTNLVSIVAFGGVGKTSLAINWWHRKQAPGAKRVLGWSFYSQGAAEDRQASAEPFLDHALRVWFGETNLPSGSWERGEKLAELIRRERTLLILDGLEPIQFPPGPQVGHFKDPGMEALLRELSIHNPGLCVCTSRLSLTDLDGPGTLTIDLDNLTPEAGAQYLQTLDVKGPEEELQKASKDFDNHALALTLLGNLLVKRYKGDIYKRDTIPTVLDEHKQGAHARRVLRQYEYLFKDKPELDVLRILGLFDRPADGTAIKPLRKLSARVWANALETLEEARLIEYDDPDGDLDCHPLIREHFAKEYRASKPDEFVAAQSQLYEYYSEQAPYQPDTLEEMAPLFYAVYHGCQAKKHERVVYDVYVGRILRGRESFLIHGLGALGISLSLLANLFATRWCEPVLALSKVHDRLWAMGCAGFALRALGRLREAAEPLRASADGFSSQAEWAHAAISLSNLAQLHWALGDIHEAIKVARRAVEVADKSDDEHQPFLTRAVLAHAVHQTGDSNGAASVFAEAEKIQAERQPSYQVLYSIQGHHYCELLLEQGKEEEVLRRASDTLAWGEMQGRVLDTAVNNLSLSRANAAGSVEAARLLDQSVSGLRRAGALDCLPLGLLARAAHFRHTREWDKAQHDLDEVRVLATRCGMRLHLTDYHLEQARLLIAQQRTPEAQPHYEAAKKLIEETGYHRRDGELADLEKQLT